MPEIISASRRTDIPAYFSAWLLQRLQAGFCEYWHAFSRRWFRVSLLPEDVLGIVFWTKNIGPLAPHLAGIRQRYPFYVHFTINAYPRTLEPHAIPTEEALSQAWTLSRSFGPASLLWRFDPIVHTEEIGPADTLARFRRLCEAMQGVTGQCITSFMSPYRRQRQAFAAAGVEWRPPSADLRRELAEQMAAVAAEHGISLTACCNDEITGGKVRKAHCVDPALLEAVGAQIPHAVPRAPSREGCGCYRSLDIGCYDLCGGGCLYCYANQDHARADRNRARHRVEHVALADAMIRR